MHTPLMHLFSEMMSPTLLISVYKTNSIPFWLYGPAISVPLLALHIVCLRGHNQNNQDVSHFNSIMTLFLLLSRSLLIITSILYVPL